MIHRVRVVTLVFSALLGAFAQNLAAQEFPNKPLRIVVPYVPGGVTDTLARVLSIGMSKNLGQNVLVEHKPGAGGILATEYVAKSVPADGYTLLITAPALAVYPIFNKLSFSPVDDLKHISMLVDGQLVMWTNTQTPFATFNDMISYAKSNPGKLTFGVPGIQSNITLHVEAMKEKFGVDIALAPYKGSGDVRLAVARNDVQLSANDIGSVNTEAQAGRARPLAITGTRRSQVFPNTPTFAELGHNDFVFNFWLGLAAPAATPQATLAKISSSVMATMQTQEAKDALAKTGLDIVANSPEAAAVRFNAEAKFFATAAQRAGIKAQ